MGRDARQGHQADRARSATTWPSTSATPRSSSRKDRKPAKATKTEFKDRQLDAALEYLRGQIKMASRVPSKKAG